MIVIGEVGNPRTAVAFTDGDRLALCVADGLVVGEPRTVAADMAEWTPEDVPVPLGQRFGWGLLAEDSDTRLVWWTFRDGWVKSDRMGVAVLCDGGPA